MGETKFYIFPVPLLFVHLILELAAKMSFSTVLCNYEYFILVINIPLYNDYYIQRHIQYINNIYLPITFNVRISLCSLHPLPLYRVQ